MSNATRILFALIIGLIGGVLVGQFAPIATNPPAYWVDYSLDIIGTLWLNGLRMTVVPLVVALLVTGVVQSAAAARAGPMAARTIIWIVAMMFLSAVAGAILTPSLLALFPMPVESAAALRAALTTTAAVGEQPSLRDFVVALVPTNPVAAASETSVLPLLIFTLVFAFAVTRLPPVPQASLAGFFSAIADAMIIVIEWVLRLAPIGVFALAFVVGLRSGTA
ncbi:MAG: cation:dicarboxylate symporter family transporter, partial [Sphingomonas sp.]